MVNEKPRTALAVRGFMLVMNNLQHGYSILSGSQKASHLCEAFFCYLNPVAQSAAEEAIRRGGKVKGSNYSLRRKEKIQTGSQKASQ